MKSPTRDVMVTGIGCVTPLGADAETTWRGLIAGRDRAGPVELFDVSGCRCQIASQATLPPLEGVDPKNLRRLPRASRLAIPAAREALVHAGLLDDDGRCKLPELALSASTTGGGMALGEMFLRRAMQNKKLARLFLAARYLPPNQIVDLQEHLGFRGHSMTIANACASGANAIGHAADLIRAGFCDCVLTGGYEALTELIFVGFDCLQASTPERCRPFDVNRTGMMLGEGAGFLVLESEEHAKMRGAKILCRLAGYGHSTDLHHLTQPEPSGQALIRAMTTALEQAALSPRNIGYINAHGTATPLNDAAEAAAFGKFFGTELDGVRISSTKAAIGHTLGAAGSIEGVFAVKALLTGELPPQLNVRTPEPSVAASLARPGDRLRAGGATMSVNLGFGGSNAALVFAKRGNAP